MRQHLADLARLGRSPAETLAQVLGNPFDREVLGQVPEELAARFVAEGIARGWERLEPPDPEILAHGQGLVARLGPEAPAAVRAALAERELLRGEWAKAEGLAEGADAKGEGVRGALAFLRGDTPSALEHYQRGLKLLRAEARRRKIFFSGVPGLFFVLVLLGTGDAARRREARRLVHAALGGGALPLRGTYLALDCLLAALAGEPTPPPGESDGVRPGDLEARNLAERLVAARAAHRGFGAGPSRRPAQPATLDTLWCALCTYWMGQRQPAGRLDALEDLYSRAEQGGIASPRRRPPMSWVLSARPFTPESPSGCEGRIGAPTEWIRREEPWERSLKAALELFGPEGSPGGTGQGGDARLAWALSWNGHAPAVRPVEQKRNARGQWSAGRNVALKRLREEPDSLPFLTHQDREACAAIRVHDGGYWDRPTLFLDPGPALRALVGHPLVVLEGSPGVRVEVLRGEPELRLERSDRQVTLRVVPEPGGESGIQVLRESPTRVRVVEYGPRARRLAELFGPEGLKVPAKAEDRLHPLLAAAAGELTVHCDEGALGPAEEVAADPRPRLHLVPAGQGLGAELLVQPLGSAGPCCAPGDGGRSLLSQVEGRRVGARRDLEAERRAAEAVVAACPALGSAHPAGPWAWTVADPEDCLDLLLQLQALGDEVVVAWPQGETLKAPRTASWDSLTLSVRQERDWFAAEGGLAVDGALTLGLRELLDLAASAPGRFVPVGDGQFLALTQAFRKRLDELRAYTEPHGKGLRFHPLAAPALEECAAEAGSFRADKGWKDLLRRFAEARELDPPLPPTLQAELRPYQLDGYRWLARLAHWGVGACLADDMGLGKTLQALALILTRAKKGPCLVVAPTSVCANWVAEAARFAPTLRPVVFGPGDRERAVAALGPFDVLVTSYGLLLQEAKRLAAVDWEVAVLDEAQAIKNAAAKRSQAALSLRAKFKLITTGTPVENHPGELWNLFRFLNPGLLGSRESFQKRFAAPIEAGDRAAQTRLKRLVSPFLLRRTKGQVLEDLPPRTEILHRVELGPEEAALYEALRTRALERLAQWQGPPLAKRFQVLAELMRLRRACCHPSLVLPETAVPSAKLEAFGEILDELLANRHRALVFSQFVDHLGIVRAYVERRGVAYQYLDGATPARDRKRRVDAFQAGEGELFLISLKAGGLGLNLTGADYVVHLDPWWNPAVEDQASDRAHRIGQTRPVTVYRLVAKGTVEDKIVELHRHKRAVAQSLLEDADGGGRLSADELLEILRGQ